jgi:taurine transport system ATP-binding protein
VGLVLAGVSHAYATRRGAVPALARLDLDVEAGEFVALVGPSGCGKSTLLGLVAGFTMPTTGTITVDGRPVTRPGPDRGVVFQQPNLYPWMTARENVAFGPRLRGVRRRERRAIADRWLELVGLAEFADAAPYELSGGMQQRCQIARVLAAEPQILLLDEPFASLDALTRERLQDELHRLWEGSGRTVLFVTHGVEEAAYLATRVIVLSERPGRVLFDERSPLNGAPRVPELRTASELIGLRERIDHHLRQREEIAA